MDIVHEKVKHSSFGNGIVVEQHNTSIFVEFDDGETRPFVYPEDFDKGLVAENNNVQNKIREEIAKNDKDPFNKPIFTVESMPISQNDIKGNLGDNILQVGKTWQGFSYAEMINKILGTNHKRWMQALHPLDKFGHMGKAAWFVFMDGSVHGHGDDLWENFLCDDGNTIKEQFAGKHIENFYDKMSRGIPCRNRAAFRRFWDKDNSRKIYKCEFVGYFEMEFMDNKNGLRVYRKLRDSLILRK